jgi:hypothetical protein
MPAKNKSTKKETEDKSVVQLEETTNQVDVAGLIKTFTHIVNLDMNSLYKENNTQAEYEYDLEEKNKLFLEITQLTLRINNIRGELVDLIVKIQQKYKATYQLNNSVNLNDENDEDTDKKDKLPNDTIDDDVDDVPIVDVKLKKDTKTKVEPGETLVEEVVKSKKTKKTTKSSDVVIEESDPVLPVTEKSNAKVEEVQETKPKKKTTKKVAEPTPVEQPAVEQPSKDQAVLIPMEEYDSIIKKQASIVEQPAVEVKKKQASIVEQPAVEVKKKKSNKNN